MIITAPERIPINSKLNYVFLAGTIDNGASEDWQERVCREIGGYNNLVILNPRKKNWNSSCEQKFENPEFFQQVSWEIDGLEKSNAIIFNFLPDSQSPITLMELGLFAPCNNLTTEERQKDIYVCCPDEFWRSGNVHFVCNKFNIPVFKDISGLLFRFNG